MKLLFKALGISLLAALIVIPALYFGTANFAQGAVAKFLYAPVRPIAESFGQWQFSQGTHHLLRFTLLLGFWWIAFCVATVLAMRLRQTRRAS